MLNPQNPQADKEGELHLFIGGFKRDDYVEADLIALLRPYGEVTGVYCKGTYAFAFFASEASVEAAAAALNGHTINGAILSARAQYHGENKKTAERGQQPQGVLFAGGLKEGHDEKYFRELFAPFCELKRVIMKRGYAFLHFPDEDMSLHVLEQMQQVELPFALRLQTSTQRSMTTKKREHDSEGVMLAPALSAAQAQGKEHYRKMQSAVSMVHIRGFGEVPVDQVHKAVSQLCASYGEVADMTIAPDNVTVIFRDSTLASRMVADFPDGSDWMGHKLRFTAMNTTQNSYVKPTSLTCVGIAPLVTQRELQLVFGLFGNLSGVTIYENRTALIEYCNESSACEAAAFLQGKTLDGVALGCHLPAGTLAPAPAHAHAPAPAATESLPKFSPQDQRSTHTRHSGRQAKSSGPLLGGGQRRGAGQGSAQPTIYTSPNAPAPRYQPY